MLAQMVGGAIPYWIKLIVIVAGLIAILAIVCKTFGWNPPPWLIQICVVVAVVVVALIAINIILSL